MFSIFYHFRFLSVCMFIFLSLSIICQFLVGVSAQHMLQESENMNGTENKILKKCRQKYIYYYQLNGRMVNTSVFVDKYLKKLTFLGIPLTRILHLSGQLMFFFILTTGISIFLQLSLGKTLFDMMPYYLVSILGLYLYFSVMSVMNLEERKKLIRVNMVDFLDNQLCPRLQAAAALKKDPEQEKKEEKKREQGVVVNFSQQQELEELLEELLN